MENKEQIEELQDLIEEIENFTYWYNEVDNYFKMCELCDKDPFEQDELVDEERLVCDVIKNAEEWELQHIKYLLEDIELDDWYRIVNWYWRPRSIERSDVEWIAKDKIKELQEEIEYLKNEEE